MSHQNPCNISPEIRAWMRSLGYVPEDELEEATGTTKRSRSRWRSPRGVMFGTVKWFPLTEIKRHLDARAADAVEDENVAVL